MAVTTCIDMCIDMCIGMCMDMCIGMYIDMCPTAAQYAKKTVGRGLTWVGPGVDF